MTALTMTQATPAEGTLPDGSAPTASAGWTIAVEPRPLPPVATTWRARLVSALCFGGVCVAMVGAGFAAAQFGGIIGGIGSLIGLLGLYGIPAALLLGWIFGPRAGWGTREELAGFGFKVGALAVVIGDLTVVVATLIGATTSRELGPDLVGIAVAFYSAGLIIFGLPALIATVPASWVWMALLRRIVASRAAR